MAENWPTDADLVARLSAGASRVRIAVVGDVMLDRFTDGAVHAREADSTAPVLVHATIHDAAGGAANVALNAAALGAEVQLVGLVGADEAGVALGALIAAHGVKAAELIAEADRPTTVKHRFRDQGRTLLRVDRESRVSPDGATDFRLEAAALAALGSSDVLVLSDYVKGVLGPGLAARLVREARQRGVPVLVDTKAASPEGFAGATCLTPNEQELQRLTGCGEGDQALAEGARALRVRLGVEAVIVTLGARGAALFAAGMEHRLGAGSGGLTVDPSGAGDSFLAAVAVGLGRGLPLVDAARLGHLAGRQASMRSGTSIVGIDDLLSAPDEVVNGTGDDETLRAVAGWRRAGLRIGFTNGCFDLLHAGHVHLLAEARAACDRLIVGVNTDGSVRGLKGPGRPVHRLEHRMAVLAALRAVDHVVAFSESTPLRLIEAIRPDVLIKGSDYRIDQVVGAPLVAAYGGRVLLVDLVADLSTSASLAHAESGAA
jgi:D-beta-D-heptose 7-phosphate kinase/D-beta-D-heptose 1-phosphate adenosyltransferase